MTEQTLSKIAPDADEIGAGDDVVIFNASGAIVEKAVLADVDGDEAEVRIGHALFKTVPYSSLAHPDSPAAEASRMRPLTDLERECLTSMYERGLGIGTPGGEAAGLRLLRRDLLGVADRLPNGEGGIVAITAVGCKALGRPVDGAFRLGD